MGTQQRRTMSDDECADYCGGTLDNAEELRSSGAYEAKLNDIFSKVDEDCDGKLSEEEVLKFERLFNHDERPEVQDFQDFIGKPAKEMVEMFLKESDDLCLSYFMTDSFGKKRFC